MDQLDHDEQLEAVMTARRERRLEEAKAENENYEQE